MTEGDIVSWVWREKLDHSIDFKVVFVELGMEAGEEIVVLDTKRCRRHSGSVVADTSGGAFLSLSFCACSACPPLHPLSHFSR